MTAIDPKSYRAAFVEYIRKGTPLRLGCKQAHATESYVWRTRRDGKVRIEHRRNDGQVFRWDEQPPTGHPGQAFNCRCEAIPYVPGQTEFAHHELIGDLSSAPYRWNDLDFIAHYYYGNGIPVTLWEMGHLREIAEYYAYSTLDNGAFRRLSDQIAEAARQGGVGDLTYDFSPSYDFDDVQFSHGGGSVSGVFSGTVTQRGAMYIIQGTTRFVFSDIFADPLGLGMEPGGTPFGVSGRWAASFLAEVLVNEEASSYFPPKQPDE
jgi:Phage Mu protein F like protein